MFGTYRQKFTVNPKKLKLMLKNFREKLKNFPTTKPIFTDGEFQEKFMAFSRKDCTVPESYE